jgi:hypothetical protein
MEWIPSVVPVEDALPAIEAAEEFGNFGPIITANRSA